MNIKLFFVFVVALCVSYSSEAQRSRKSQSPAVLDFEGDRIGGERTGPFQSFLQGSQGPSFQSVLYMRKDFLEFQRSEFRRPKRGQIYRERIIFKRDPGDFAP
jgi:hypothetical protein